MSKPISLLRVAEARSALATVRQSAPDLILLDLPRSRGASVTLARALHSAAPGARVVVLVHDAARMDVAGHVRAGVSAFLMAEATAATRRQTLQSVARGHPVLPPELTRRFFNQIIRLGR